MKMVEKSYYRVLIVLGLLMWAGSAAVSAAEPGRMRVLTTILPIYCFTKQVAEGAADVENLLPSGVGPHDYQLSPKDIRKIVSADLIIKNGLNLESWLEKALKANRGGKQAEVVEAAAGMDAALIYVDAEHGHEGHTHERGDGHGGHAPDPHVWLDPMLARHQVANIARALQMKDPANARVYERNAARLVKRLEDLDGEIRGILEQVRVKPFVTFHNAFPYFVKRYRLNLIGVVELSPEVQPSPRYLRELYQRIRGSGAKAIFTEPQFSSKLIRQIAKDLDMTVGELDPMETGELNPGAYEEGMRRNAQNLREHLK